MNKLFCERIYFQKQEFGRALDQYRQSQIIICVGQGAWEGPMIADAARMKEIMASKDIPCWVDFWGHDVNHDWPWWRRQFPYFLEKLYG